MNTKTRTITPYKTVTTEYSNRKTVEFHFSVNQYTITVIESSACVTWEIATGDRVIADGFPVKNFEQAAEKVASWFGPSTGAWLVFSKSMDVAIDA
jgi:hypothetical protein